MSSQKFNRGILAPSFSVLGAGHTGYMRVAHAIYSFAADGGAVGLITPAYNAIIPANAIIVGGIINSTTAVTSSGSATVSIGTSAGSSAASVLAATGKASFSLAAQLQPIPAFTAATYFKMSAAGQVTVTVAVQALTAGVIDIHLYYSIANA
jgi:hypothetical protein